MDKIKSLINELAPSFGGKKIILGIFGFIIVGELVWAGWTLFKPVTPQVAIPIINQQMPETPTVIKLDSQTPQVKVGDKFTVSIQLLSDKNTDGADIIIRFDPALLGVEVVGSKKLPVILGSLFQEYPVNTLEAKTGEIIVSGISTVQGGVLGNGLLGSVVFIAKKTGEAKIYTDFAKGSTTDSNVLQTGTGEDILSAVEDLNITIMQ